MFSPICGDSDVCVHVSSGAHQWPWVTHEDGVGVARPHVVAESEQLAVETNLAGGGRGRGREGEEREWWDDECTKEMRSVVWCVEPQPPKKTARRYRGGGRGPKQGRKEIVSKPPPHHSVPKKTTERRASPDPVTPPSDCSPGQPKGNPCASHLEHAHLWVESRVAPDVAGLAVLQSGSYGAALDQDTRKLRGKEGGR